MRMLSRFLVPVLGLALLLVVAPVMANEPGTLNCWAPEFVYDSDQGQFLVFWASTVPSRFPLAADQLAQVEEPPRGFLRALRSTADSGWTATAGTTSACGACTVR